MTNHVHLIVGKEGEDDIEDIVRDFKKFTSVQICKAIESNLTESRREWMLELFKRAGGESGKHTKYMFWQNDYHPVELSTNLLLTQKLDYIHNNPVTAGIVDKAEEYLYSSARDYYGSGKGLLDIMFIE
jgi:REP element-mobilizing transposase RayT